MTITMLTATLLVGGKGFFELLIVPASCGGAVTIEDGATLFLAYSRRLEGDCVAKECAVLLIWPASMRMTGGTRSLDYVSWGTLEVAAPVAFVMYA